MMHKEKSKFTVGVIIFCFSEDNRYLMALNHQVNKCWPNLQVALHASRQLRAYVIKSFDLPLNSGWLKQSHLIKLQIYWTAPHAGVPNKPFQTLSQASRSPHPNPPQQYLTP